MVGFYQGNWLLLAPIMAALASCWFTMEPSAHLQCTKRDCASRRQQSSKNTCWSHASCTKYILFSWYRGVTGIATICEQISKWVRQTQNHLSIGEPVILALRFQVSVEIGQSPRGKSCQEDYVVTSQTENCVCELYAWKWALQFIAIRLGTSRNHLKFLAFPKWHSNSK